MMNKVLQHWSLTDPSLWLPFPLRIFPLAVLLPTHFRHEDQEGRDDTEEKPPVDELDDGRFGQALCDALIHRVHHEHDGQWQADRDLL